MLVKTVTKWDKIREFINIWLKDPTVYCGNCDMTYIEGIKCCKEPLLGTNLSFTKDIIEAVKDLRKLQKNEFASNKNNTFRTLVKLPKRLFRDLNKFCKSQFNCKLFEDKVDHIEFAKKFKMFTVAEKV